MGIVLYLVIVVCSYSPCVECKNIMKLNIFIESYIYIDYEICMINDLELAERHHAVDKNQSIKLQCNHIWYLL